MKRISCYLLLSLQVLCFWFTSSALIAADPSVSQNQPTIPGRYDTRDTGRGPTTRDTYASPRRPLRAQDLIAAQQQPRRIDYTQHESRWIAVLQPGLAGKRAATLNKVVADSGAAVIDQFTSVSGYHYALLEPDAAADLGKANQAVRAKSGGLVQLVPARRFHLLSAADPWYSRQYGLKNNRTAVEAFGKAPKADADINVEAAWRKTVGSKDIVVAVVDSGVDLQHPDLQANLWRNSGEIPNNQIDDDQNGYVDDVHGYDFGGGYGAGDGDPDDTDGHGTHVAGIIGAAAHNGVGGRGVNQDVSIMAVRAFGEGGFTNDFLLAKSLDYAVANGADVINASWGGGSPSALIEQALKDAEAAGVLVVIAAGNESQHIGNGQQFIDAYPAAYQMENTITVAATDGADEIAPYSNIGPHNVHLAAPGSNIYSTMLPHRFVYEENFEAATPGGLPAGWNGESDVWQVVQSSQADVNNRAIRARGNRDGMVTLPALDIPRSVDSGMLGPFLNLHISITAELPQGASFVWQADLGEGWKDVLIFAPDALPHYEKGYYSWLFPFLIEEDNERLQMRLVYNSGGSDETFGVEIDNLMIYAPLAERDLDTDYNYAYQPFSGTSMAAPHVAGAAALLLADDPTLSPSALKMRLIATGDVVPSFEGQVGSERRLDVGNAIEASGGLTLATDLSDKALRLGERHPLVWHHFDDPDAATELVLIQNGSVVAGAQADLTRSGGLFNWNVPEITPGRYLVELRSGNQRSAAQEITIQAAAEIHVPDVALRAWLGGTFDSNGDDRLVTQELNDFRGFVRVPAMGVKDTTGLEQFHNVQVFQFNYNHSDNVPDYSNWQNLNRLILAGPRVTSLPSIPDSVVTLQLENMPVEALPNLPASIENLILENLAVTELPALPADELRLLALSHLPLTELGRLPKQLTDGFLMNMPITELENLPDSVSFDFYLHNLALRSLPPVQGNYARLFISGLPLTRVGNFRPESSIYELSLINNPRLAHVGGLPNRLNGLNLSHNRLRTLPSLPEGLWGLNVTGNLLTALPTLPAGLAALQADDNLLTTLPTLPADLNELSARNNRITTFPEFLGDRVLNLDLAGNQLTALGDLSFPYLFFLDVSRNQLQSLPLLAGDYLEVVDVADNQLSELPPLTDLAALKYLNASHNFLEAIPTLDNPLLSAVHLQGNLFDRGDCSDIATIQALDLPGFILAGFGGLKGKPLDPFLFQPNRDGSMLLCDGLNRNVPVSNIHVFPIGPERAQVTWRDGVAKGAAMGGYQVYIDLPGRPGRLMGTYPANQTTLPLGALKPGALISVLPKTRAGELRFDLMGRITVAAEDLAVDPESHREHTFPATAFLGEPIDTVVVSGRYDRDAFGFGVYAYDAGGARIAEGYPQRLPSNRNHVFRLADVFDADVRGRAARFSVVSSAECGVSVRTNGSARAAAVDVPAFGQTSGMLTFEPVGKAAQVDRLLVINPNHVVDRDATLEIRLWGPDQQVIAGREITLAGGETAVWNPLDWIPAGETVADPLMITWRSDVPLMMWDHRLANPDDVLGQGRLLRGDRPSLLRGTFHTPGDLVYVENPHGFETQVHFTLKQPDGGAFMTRTLAVPAYTGVYTEIAKNLLVAYHTPWLSPASFVTFEADHPVYVSLETNGAALNGLGGIAQLGSEWILPNVETANVLMAADLRWDAETESSIHVVNQSDTPQDVTAILYNHEGERMNLIISRVAPGGAAVIDRDRLLQEMALTDWSEIAFMILFAEQNGELQGYHFFYDKHNQSFTAKRLDPMF